MKTQNKELLSLLADCAAACNHCSTACLEEKDVAILSTCIQLDMDCAQICSLTAAFISRDSGHARHLIRECVEICRQCAEECGKHAHMEHCKVCAEACRRCAEACKAEE